MVVASGMMLSVVNVSIVNIALPEMAHDRGVDVPSSSWVVTGVLVSQTNDAITLKSADALVRTFKKEDVEAFKKQSVSLMPADLQKSLSAQDLADVVEYLGTLKK